MNVQSLRSSSISCYGNCPFNFYLSYIVGFPSEGNRKADRGTATHWVLEAIAKAARRGNAHSPRYRPELLLRIFFRRYKEKYGFTDEDFAECMNHLRIVQESQYYPANLKVVATEKQFEFQVLRPGFETLDNKPLKLRGTIDLITEYTDHKGRRILRIIDWKTGRRTDWKTGKMKGYKELHEDMQLRLYHLIVNYIYPGYDAYEVVIFFIMDGGPFQISFDPKDLEITLDQLRRIFTKIKKDRYFQRLKDDSSRRDEAWKCTYVCQFGKIERTFVSSDGELLTDAFKYNKHNEYPDLIEDTDGKVYEYIEDTETTLCDKYRKILLQSGETRATTTLTNLTIQGEPIAVSARNNFEAEGIHYGVIK